MKIVITGATGNLGTALIRALSTGEHELVGLARRVPDLKDQTPYVGWRSVDLTDESSADVLRRTFAGADAVVHLAWGFQPSHDIAYLEALGVGGTRRVLDAAVAAGVPHLVHMSSVGAYSPKADDRPVDEDWPTLGVPGSPYSAHKAAAERVLDAHEAVGGLPMVTRMRPGIVGQHAAGSALLRYGVPGFVPSRAIGLLPVLPLDPALAIPMVHADDVADAVVRALTRQVSGAFNLAADPAIRPHHLGSALGARVVDVPARVLRALMSATWRAHVQKLDPGWLDLAMAVPLLDTARARDLLGWTPSVTAETVLAETVAGIRAGASSSTPALRPRTVASSLRDLVRHGPVSHRQRP
jgi:nucleoside-diphosphate-sugar epimerase